MTPTREEILQVLRENKERLVEKHGITKLGLFGSFIVLLLCCSIAIAEEPRTLFNHGAELAALGQFDEATDILRQAAVVRDKTIAAKSLALLGQIAASSAREHIADNPMETLPEDRQKIFEHLQSAERSFVESLTVQPNAEVRRYLETLRVWRHNTTNAWDEYDREQRRNVELQERIRWLADWEEKLTDKVRPLLEEPNSPRKFQAGFEAGREQKKLADELARLQEVPIADEELAEKWTKLPEIQEIANEAAELLTRHRTEAALPKQEQVLEYLRSLLPLEESQQDQQNQEQQEQNQDENGQEQQDQQEQEQEQNGQDQHEQDQQSQQNGEQESGANEPQTLEGAQNTETPEERAERMLMQVRRKEQAARDLRDQLRELMMQTEFAEKDW